MLRFVPAAAALVIATPLAAREPVNPPAAVQISGAARVLSDYRDRGVSASDGKPALQGEVAAEIQSGFYGGIAASTLPDSVPDGDFELGLNAGWNGAVAPGLRANAGVLYNVFPGKAVSDYVELFANTTYSFGPARAKVGVIYAPAGQVALDGRDSNLHVFGSLATAVPGTAISLDGRVGYNRGSLTFVSDFNRNVYYDWRVGASYALGPVTLGVRYWDSDLPEVNDALRKTVAFRAEFGF